MAVGSTARTGERCPESGVWQVVGVPSTTAPIARGNVMPPYAGKSVTWRLAAGVATRWWVRAPASTHQLVSARTRDRDEAIEFERIGRRGVRRSGFK